MAAARSFRNVVVTFLLIAFCILAPAAIAQGITGSITGTVTDPSGAAIPQATVTITQTATNTVKTLTTSESGFYTVTQLPPGDYTVVIEKSGFSRFEQTGLTLTINQVAQVSPALKIGSSQQQITITSDDSPLIQTDTSSIGLVIDAATIQETPLNGHTNLIGLIGLAPGVQSPGAQDQVPYFGVTPSIGTGGRNAFGGIGFTLDGVQSKSGTLQRGLADTPSLDAIGEFKTITNGEPAEFNQPAQIIVVTASGGNRVHGGAFEFNRGKGTGAKPYFNGAVPRPPYERNEFGGNLSAPIIIPHLYNGRDKSFFFYAFEGFRLTQSNPINTQQPSLAFRAGDFSSLTTVIKDPLTGLPFPNNMIPQSRFNPVTQALQAVLIPLPTIAGNGTNTFELVPYKSHVDRHSVRIDHKINETNQFRATFLSAFYGPNNQTGVSSKAGGMAGIGEHDTLVILGLTHAFTPTLLLDSYAAYTHLVTFRNPQNYMTNFNSIIPGLPVEPIQGAPTLNITNIQSISEAGSKDYEQDIQGYTTLSKVLSRHSIKTGVNFLYSNHFNISAVSPARGSFSFTNRFTGNAYADFLLGYPTTTQLANPGALSYRNITDELGAFIQDDWKLTPKLTVNAGIRYDIQFFPDNVYGNQASFVPSIGKVVVFAKSYPAAVQPAFLPLTTLSSTVGLPDSLSAYLGKDANNVAPRLGFAYQVLPNTVIRGAGGIFFNLIPASYAQATAFTAFPFSAVQSFNQPASGPPTFSMNNPFSATGAFNANPSAVEMHSPVTPYTEQYNLTVERQFNRGLDVRASYVGQHNVKQNNSSGPGTTSPNINVANPPLVGVNSQTTNIYQPFAGISLIIDPIFHSNMNSLQLGVHKRYSHGFQINAEYQYTRVLGTENVENPSGINPNDSFGQIGGITPNVLVVSYSYELPFGSGRTFLGTAHGFTDKLIAGWQISGITTAQSGQPFSVNYTAPGSTAGLVSGRADRVPGVPLYPSNQSRFNFFNAAAFSAPQTYVAGNGLTYAQYGNSGYNLLRGPKFQNWDVNLEKNLRFADRYRVQLRAEAFNVANHPSFAAPNSNISNTGNLGTINGTASQERKVEFVAKFNF